MDQWITGINSNQPELIMKEKPFHQEYLQGRRPDQYKKSATVFAYAMVALFVTVILLLIFQ